MECQDPVPRSPLLNPERSGMRFTPVIVLLFGLLCLSPIQAQDSKLAGGDTQLFNVTTGVRIAIAIGGVGGGGGEGGGDGMTGGVGNDANGRNGGNGLGGGSGGGGAGADLAQTGGAPGGPGMNGQDAPNTASAMIMCNT